MKTGAKITRIKELRVRARMTQRILAELAGLSMWTVMSLEKGRYGATRKTRYALAEVLEVDPMSLLDSEASA